MNISSLIGKKIDQTQGFLEDGRRVPLSIIVMDGNIISQVKTTEKDGYNSIQLGFGLNKRVSKPLAGHVKTAGLPKAPRFFREVRADDVSTLTSGTPVAIEEVFEAGDIIDVTGISKGKGFAGVVKRHGFHGGPRTHGQSDRERAPGSIGQTTTPGRVYKGKKMAGRMGNEQVTVKNLEVLAIDGDKILVKGLIPGVKGSIVTVKKVGKNKKFTPLYSEKVAVEEIIEVKEVEQLPEEIKATVEEKVEEVKAEAPVVEVQEVAKEEVKAEANEEKIEEPKEEVPSEKKEEVKEENGGK